MASQCGNYFWHGSSARTAQQDVGLPSAPGYARQKPPGNIAYRIVYYDFFRNDFFRNAMFPIAYPLGNRAFRKTITIFFVTIFFVIESRKRILR